MNARQIIPAWVIGEFVGTFLLVFFGCGSVAAAVTTGAEVGIFARDFGPRLFSCFAGWGSVPFTANGFGWLTVYIVAPILGGLLGGGIYHVCFRPHYAASAI